MADEEKSRGQKDANDLGCLCNIHLVKAVLLGKCIIQLGFLQVLPPDHPVWGYLMTILCFCNAFNVSAAIASHANKILKPFCSITQTLLETLLRNRSPPCVRGQFCNDIFFISWNKPARFRMSEFLPGLKFRVLTSCNYWVSPCAACAIRACRRFKDLKKITISSGGLAFKSWVYSQQNGICPHLAKRNSLLLDPLPTLSAVPSGYILILKGKKKPKP